MRKSIFCFQTLMCLLVGCHFSWAQPKLSINKISIASPTAASLGKFGDIPASEHTGIPSINIPIFTVKEGSLLLPISIDYHASGLRVQEQASWIGAGWALNAGGVITRTVMGAPDDRNRGTPNTTKGHFSNYGYNSYIFSAGPSICGNPVTCPQGRPGMPPNNNVPQDGLVQRGVLDGEPDLFFFNFAGYSGKFYFNDDRTAMLMPEQDLQIAPLYNDADNKGFTGFVVTTSDGTKYYFGQNPLGTTDPDAIETTYAISWQQPEWTNQGAASSWFLNRIVSPDSEHSIDLIYTTEEYSEFGISMSPIPAVRNPNILAYDSEFDLIRTFFKGVRLSKIIFSNGEVDFLPGALRQDLSGFEIKDLQDRPNADATLGARSLQTIRIQSPDICRKFDFSSSYFFDGTPLTAPLFSTVLPFLSFVSDQYRLKLDGIIESSCNSTVPISPIERNAGQPFTLPSYSFSYANGTVSRKLSFAVDHWGFFNAKSTNVGLIPTYTIYPIPGVASQPQTVTGADRDSHWPGSVGGALQKITYPTGGTSTFEYEPHQITTTSSSTSHITATLSNFGLHIFGQDTARMPTARLVSQGSAVHLVMTNTAAYPVTVTIANTNNGQIVFNSNISERLGSNPSYVAVTDIALAAGLYVVTLKWQLDNVVPANNNFSGGMNFRATQDQISTTTNTYIQEIGGLRIKSITSFDPSTGVANATRYRYTFDNTDNGRSSAMLFSQPIYVQGIRNDVWATVNGNSCNPSGCLTCFGSNVSYYQSPASLRPLSTSQGSHVGYATVFVSKPGNGFIEKRFYGKNGTIFHVFDPGPSDVCVRTLSSFCDPDIPNSPAPPEQFDPMRGELAFEGYYNESGRILKSSSYLPSFAFNPIKTPGIISKFFVTGYVDAHVITPTQDKLDQEIDPRDLVNFIPVGVNTFTEYELQTARKISDHVTSIEYDSAHGSSMTTTRDILYGSAYHTQPTKVSTLNSKGQLQEETFKYAADYRITNFNAPDQLPVYNQNVAGDINYLATSLSGVNLSASDPNYYWARLNFFLNYRYMKAIDRQTYIAYRKLNFTPITGAYTIAHNTAKQSANNELKTVLELQDQSRNPIIEQTNFINGALAKSSYTQYDYFHSIGISLNPSKLYTIPLNAATSGFSNSIVNNSGINKDSRYSVEKTFLFERGSLVQVNDRDGKSESYVWDYYNNYPVARVENAEVKDVGYTSFESAPNSSIYAGSSTFLDAAPTGNKALSGSAADKIGLDPTKRYILTYWLKDGSGTVQVGSFPGTIIGRRNGWTNYQHLITGVDEVLPISSGMMDELRLYPEGSRITTYTYSPLIGITSETDSNGKTKYYEYDSLGRLKNIKDFEGNILSNYQYNYKY